MMHRLRNTLLVAALAGLCSCSFAAAPTTTYPVGVRQYNWMRGSRAITTYVYYPAASGTVGGAPVTNAPIAPGVFPICLFMHGFSSSPQNSLGMIRPLAAAGFIVPGPHFPNLSIPDISDGDLPRDISQILTNTIALNNSGTPFTGQINTTQVGVSGHSMGGMTIHALLTAYPDSRIKAAIPMSCTDQGTPSSSVVAKVFFMHGDADTTTAYSSGRQAYSEMPPPKAFLTWLGGGHNAMWGDPIMGNVAVEWMRWSLYDDTAARDRLPAAAASDHTRWESVGLEAPGTIQAEAGVAAGGVTFESNNSGYNGTSFANFPTNGGTLTFNNVNGNGGGVKALQIRYALGATAARTGSITVNGTTSNLTFNPTGSWTTWQTMTVNITLNNNSTNTIRFASTGQDLGNIDQITVPPATTTPDTYQAESATLAGGVTIDSNNSGYNGTGFANFPVNGGSVTFSNVDGNGGGTKTLAIRYALGAATARTGSITVNGTTSNLTFNPTGAWNTWATLNVNITLADNSTNTIQLASTGQDLGNVDQITVP
jgi:pimeloyl-ACP methyl ester carboxylesterase